MPPGRILPRSMPTKEMALLIAGPPPSCRLFQMSHFHRNAWRISRPMQALGWSAYLSLVPRLPASRSTVSCMDTRLIALRHLPSLVLFLEVNCIPDKSHNKDDTLFWRNEPLNKTNHPKLSYTFTSATVFVDSVPHPVTISLHVSFRYSTSAQWCRLVSWLQSGLSSISGIVSPSTFTTQIHLQLASRAFADYKFLPGSAPEQTISNFQSFKPFQQVIFCVTKVKDVGQWQPWTDHWVSGVQRRRCRDIFIFWPNLEAPQRGPR